MRAAREIVAEAFARIPAQPNASWLLGIVLLLAFSDVAAQLSGNTVVPGGPADETAHVATALLVLWVLGARATERFVPGALITSFAIDADHLPSRLGTNFLTSGTPRPYTHSLLTIAVVLALAALVRRPRRRDLILGVAVGLALHFWRDLAEPGTGVSLLWPWSKAAFSVPHWAYLVAMGLMVSLLVAVQALAARGRGHMSSEGSGLEPGSRSLDAATWRLAAAQQADAA